jgi:DNA-binding MarR family transcriptional regulator
MNSKTVSNFNNPAQSTGFVFWQTTMTWQRLINRSLSPYKITHMQFVVLAVIYWLSQTKSEINQQDIAKYSKIDKMQISSTLSILEKKELVSRIQGQIDTRVKKITLTKQGLELVQKAIPVVEKTDSEFFSKEAEINLPKKTL